MEGEMAGLGLALSRAKDLEREFDWRAAAEEYLRACTLLAPAEVMRLGAFQEARAHALYRHAFQAETGEEFDRRSAEAAEEYAKAKDAYSRLGAIEAVPWSSRCDAMVAFLGLWSVGDGAERRRLIAEAWAMAKRAMDSFLASRDFAQLRHTNNVLTLVASLVYVYSPDSEARASVIRDALQYSEKALESLPEEEDMAATARAQINVSYYSRLYCSEVADPSQREEWDRRAGEHWAKGIELSEEGAFDALLYSFKFGMIPSSASSDETNSFLPRMCEYATRTRDRLRLAAIYEWKESRKYAQADEAVDPESRDSFAEEALELARRSKACFSVFSSMYLSEAIWWSGAPEVGYYEFLSSSETDLTKKRLLAQKGVEALEEGLRLAEECDYLEGMAEISGDAAKILINLARTEKSPEEKRLALGRAATLSEQFLDLWQSLHPKDFFLWTSNGLLAEVEHDLADLTTDPGERLALYAKAIRHLEEACDGIVGGMAFVSKPVERWSQFRLYALQYKVVNWSLQVYRLSRDKNDLARAADASRKSVELCKLVDQPSRLAESYWKAAQVHDERGDFLGASESFRMAASSYSQAAESLPRLAGFYRDYELHMQALSQVELARHHHRTQAAAAASECYGRAAEMYESTDRWRFLAPNYMALAEFEIGDDLSRKDRNKDARAAFEKAAKLYSDSSRSLSGDVGGLLGQDERESALTLIKEAGSRQEHCKARAALEEARQLDKEGQMNRASEMYAQVSEKFEDLRRSLTRDQDRTEVDLIIAYVNAWKAMARAEAESSPELYEEASRLFEEARKLSSNEKALNLAMGHSRFCRALSAGVRFADTGDASHHSAAMKHLESASRYYLKAGVDAASDYAKASKLLFEGYAYMGRASAEEDEGKKAKLYSAAEKVLEVSSSSFERAGYPGKKEQVLKLVEKVREDREIAVSLAAVFLAPDVLSNTMAFSSSAAAFGTAVGMDRFEHADVQAALVASPTNLHVHQEISLEIEMVNSGRGPAQLMRVEDAVPKGFELIRAPDRCRAEDGWINLRGRKLDALKTEDVLLVIRPNVRGKIEIRPRITYLDELGRYRSCEPKPVTITVKEMGLTGWLKGT